jgi:hypothetical protein
MNMLSTYTPEAATFQTLVVANEFCIQGEKVYFSLILDKHPQVYVTAVVEANHATGSTVWNTTSDPQNEVDVEYDKLEIAPYNVAVVDDFDEVLAAQGQPFLLTQAQAQSLNDMLNEHFEELKINELKGFA